MPTEPDLLSAVIPLTAEHGTEGSEYLGRAAYGWCLALIREVDTERAKELHAARQVKPCTVSALVSAEKSLLVQPEVRAGERYWVRFTAMGSEWVDLMLGDVLPALPATARLGRAHFQVGEAIVDQKQHRWARLTSTEALYERWMGEQRAPRRFNLRFASVTATRQVRRNLLVPEPRAVFGGYLRTWNRYGQPTFGRDLLEMVYRDVWITAHELRTSVVQVGGASEPGYVGWCGYTVFSREPAARRVINLLADLSQFCGTGVRATQGMGQTRREDVAGG